MSTDRIARLIATLLAFTVGMIVGAGPGWAITALFVVLLGLLIAFSAALAKLETDRDRYRELAARAPVLRHMQPWQVAMLDRALDPDFKRTYISAPKRSGLSGRIGAVLSEVPTVIDGADVLPIDDGRRAIRPTDKYTLRKDHR